MSLSIVSGVASLSRSLLPTSATACARWLAAVPRPAPTEDTFPHSKEGKTLHPDLLNEAVKKTQYAVRGELYLRAMQLQDEGMKIIFTNGAHGPTPRHLLRAVRMPE
jgi:hypothetical protein